MDNYDKIRELKAKREQKQQIFLVFGYIVLVAICSNAADGNIVAGIIIATLGCVFCATAVLGGIAIYNDGMQKEDCKKYLTKETYNKMLKQQAKHDAQVTEQQLLSPAQKQIAKTAAAGYAGYKIGKSIAKW